MFGNTFVPSGSNKKRLLSFGSYRNLSPMLYTSPTNNPYICSFGIKNLVLHNWIQSFAVVGTNDLSNFWDIQLLTTKNFLLISRIYSFDFFSGGWVSSSKTIEQTISYNEVGLYINCLSTGAPGGLYFAPPYCEFSE
jgi:hypothetical protein